MDATAQADLVRTREATPSELVDAAIERIERCNPELNAVIHPRFEQARVEAAGALPDGPFRGVPFLLKDLDGFSAGDPYHAGNRLLRDRGHVADTDSYMTRKFREAGLVILGRTNTPELGLQPATEPLAYGPTHNPWNPDHSTGGSSGGSAAAVASGMVPMAHAGDGGGSIRVPASECGLVGLKPSRGRHSLGPELGEAWGGFVIRLALTRSVRDCAAVLQAVQGPMPGDPYTAPPPRRPYPHEVGVEPGRLRVGYTTQPADPSVLTTPECVAAVERTAAWLEELGHDVEESRPEVWDDEDVNQRLTGHFLSAFGVWTAVELERLGELVGHELTAADVEPGTWAIAEVGRSVRGVDYLAAMEFFHGLGRLMAHWWDDPADGGAGHDVLLTPTIPEPPPTLGQFMPTEDNPMVGLFRAAQIVPFVMPFNITGQPAMSLPLHWSDEGLPLGVQLVAAYGREDLLIRLAAQLERAHPWADRRPPVHA